MRITNIHVQTFTFRDIQQWKHLQQSCASQWKNTRKSVWTQIRKLQNDKSTNIVHNTSVFSPCLFNTHFQTAMNVTDGLCVYFISSSPCKKNTGTKCQSPPSGQWNISCVLYSWMSRFSMWSLIRSGHPLTHKVLHVLQILSVCLFKRIPLRYFLERWTFLNVTSSWICALKVQTQRARSHVHISVIGQSQGLLWWRCAFTLLGWFAVIEMRR